MTQTTRCRIATLLLAALMAAVGVFAASATFASNADAAAGNESQRPT